MTYPYCPTYLNVFWDNGRYVALDERQRRMGAARPIRPLRAPQPDGRPFALRAMASAWITAGTIIVGVALGIGELVGPASRDRR